MTGGRRLPDAPDTTNNCQNWRKTEGPHSALMLVAMMHVVLWWCGDYSAWGGRRLHVCFVAWLLMVASTWRAGDGYW